MADRTWQASGRIVFSVTAGLCLIAALAHASLAWADQLPQGRAAAVASLRMGEIVTGGIVVCCFAAAVILWFAALRDGRTRAASHSAQVRDGATNASDAGVKAADPRFLQAMFDHVPVCVVVKRISDDRYILTNRAFEKFIGRSRREVIGQRIEDVFGPAMAELIAENDQRAITNGKFRSEFTVQGASQPRVLSVYQVVTHDEKGTPEYLVSSFEDVTDRKSLSKELHSTKKFLELVVENIPIALTVSRAQGGEFLLANSRAETVLNQPREAVLGKTAEQVFSAKEAQLIVSRDEAAVKGGQVRTEEYPISTKDGLRLYLTRRKTVADEADNPLYLIKTYEDVTSRRQTESRMAHMAYHDGLTDLPNRPAFLQALTQMIEACEETGEEFAVLSVDLDGLKEINDVFGPAVGDQLLIDVAQRLQATACSGVVARLSGDEFGLIIDGRQPEAAKNLAERLAAAISQGFTIDGKSVRTGITTGISIFPRNGNTAAALLANSGAALFRAKAKSRGAIGIYEPEMDRQIRDRRVLHQDLSMAIAKSELRLHFQPLAVPRQTAAACDVIGFEVLARWQHPLRGFVSPGDFIPLAEESGLIVEIGEWILREACRQAASWPLPLQVAVNLSPAQFVHGDLVNLVHSVLLETGLAPDRLELEITEGVLIEDFDRVLATLRRLKTLGVKISMDDFGSGYSSLSYLQAFPFDKIKIDRTFIVNLGRNPQSAAIVRAVIGLGHNFDIAIVAEGVETQEQLSFLAEEGCDVVQGYFIGKPAPIEQYSGLVGHATLSDSPGLVRLTG